MLTGVDLWKTYTIQKEEDINVIIADEKLQEQQQLVMGNKNKLGGKRCILRKTYQVKSEEYKQKQEAQPKNNRNTGKLFKWAITY